MKVLVRAAFAYDGDAVSREVSLMCPEETLTVQADKDDCDINTLVKRFGLTGTMPSNLRPPIQADFVGNMTYQEALDAIREADATFSELPADVRKRFDHNPAEFVAFCSDEKNLDEMRKLGLAVPPPVVPEAVLEPKATV
jgi:phage internal scaffolding protein